MKDTMQIKPHIILKNNKWRVLMFYPKEGLSSVGYSQWRRAEIFVRDANERGSMKSFTKR